MSAASLHSFGRSAARLATVAALFLGCGGGEHASDIESPAGGLAFTLAAVDTLVVDLEVGTAAGRVEEAFGNIRDLEVGPDGSIYVLDGSVGAVRTFGSDGEYLGTLGRSGEGPGEFRRPLQMTLGPDGALWVYDDGAQAAIVLAPNGTEVARHPSLLSGPRGGPLSSIWDAEFTRNGRLTQSAQHVDPLPSGEMGVLEVRSRLFIRSLDPMTGAVDSLYLGDAPFRRYRYRSQMAGGGAGVVLGIVPFDPRRLVAVDHNGNIWTAVSTMYELQRLSETDTLIVRVDAEAAPFSSEQRASWEELEMERQLGLALPEQGHVIWRLFTDDEDRLWVHRAAGFESTGQFDVFREDGQLLGSVFLPGRISPTATAVRDGRLYAVMFDELDVQKIIRAALPAFR